MRAVSISFAARISPRYAAMGYFLPVGFHSAARRNEVHSFRGIVSGMERRCPPLLGIFLC